MLGKAIKIKFKKQLCIMAHSRISDGSGILFEKKI